VSNDSRPIALPTGDLPPILRADLAGPIVDRQSWVWTIGPAYGGVFVWIPLLDRLGTSMLGKPSLAELALTAVLAAVACHFLLYLVPAEWGWNAGHRLSVVASSTFGAEGSEWITGIGMGLAAIVVYAVSLFMAIRLTLLGLVLCGLISPGSFVPWRLGPLVLQNPVILLTCIFWIFITGMVNRLSIVSVIAGLMKVYVPVAMILLGSTALLASSGLLTFDAVKDSLAGVGVVERAGAVPAVGTGRTGVFQLIFGYFALSGLLAVDWGMTVKKPIDIRIGGWLSIILAGSFCFVMSLLTVAGAVGKQGRALADQLNGPTDPLTFHWAIFHGIGGLTGGVILMLFGLATLAPGCYAVGLAAQRFSTWWPGLSRSTWIWLTGLGAFVLVGTSWAGQIEQIFGLMGAAFAPAAGALVADALRQRMRWPGIRAGWNPPGIAAWVAGTLVGLVPLVGDLMRRPAAQRFQPAALYAFLVAGCLFWVLSAAGLEHPVSGLPKAATDDAPSAIQ
jgi:cytosine permease